MVRRSRKGLELDDRAYYRDEWSEWRVGRRQRLRCKGISRWFSHQREVVVPVMRPRQITRLQQDARTVSTTGCRRVHGISVEQQQVWTAVGRADAELVLSVSDARDLLPFSSNLAKSHCSSAPPDVEPTAPLRPPPMRKAAPCTRRYSCAANTLGADNRVPFAPRSKKAREHTQRSHTLLKISRRGWLRRA